MINATSVPGFVNQRSHRERRHTATQSATARMAVTTPMATSTLWDDPVTPPPYRAILGEEATRP
jgi:hypothetical protein